MDGLTSHYFIMVVDIEGFSTRPDPVQRSLRHSMYEVMRVAATDTRLDWAKVTAEDRGDGILMLISADTSPVMLAGEFVRALDAALAEKAAMFSSAHQLRLRVSLHQGLATRDEQGWAGDAVNTACRLVDAQPLRDALSGSARANLALIVSDDFHRSVIRPGHRSIDGATFTAMEIVVKSRAFKAWIQVPGQSGPPRPATARSQPIAPNSAAATDTSPNDTSPPAPAAPAPAPATGRRYHHQRQRRRRRHRAGQDHLSLLRPDAVMTASTASAQPTASPATSSTASSAGSGSTAPPPAAGSDSPGSAKPSQAASPPDPGASQPAGAESAGERSAPKAASDRGDDTKRATQSTGLGSARHEMAEAAWRAVNGDVVAGNKNTFLIGSGAKRQTAPLRVLSPTIAEEVAMAFVDPEGWDGLRVRFQQQRTVILRGRPGQGRTTMAVRLLRSASVESIYDFDPRLDLTQLANWIEEDRTGPDRIGSGAGFLLRLPADASWRQSFVFHGLDEALERADARLVLTVDADTQLGDDNLLRYVLELPSPPGTAKILERHLRWRIGDYAAEQALADKELKNLIDEFLAGASCEAAAALALIVSQETDAPGSAERIRERIALRGQDDFEIWFDGLRDIETRSFAIALAVLDGLPYEDVARAANRLSLRLRRRPGKGRPDPFRVAAGHRLRVVRAQTETVPVRRSFGRPSARATRYTDPQFPRKVINRAWHGYQIQDTLLAWLGDLVNGPEQVRISAGTAIGVLCEHSFDYLTTAVLDPWADGTDAQRQAVAYALRVAASDPALRTEVTRLVGGWYGDRDNPRRQATAARAHAVSLGRPDPLAAVEALDRLAMVRDIRVWVAIGDGLAELILKDSVRVMPTVFDSLLRWLDDRDRATTAQVAFLIVATGLVTDVGEPDGEIATWPTLLHLAGANAELRQHLFELWRRVLNETLLFVDEAEQVMTAWAGFAEADDVLLEVFARFVRATVGKDKRTRETLLRYAEKWRAEDNLQPLPKASEAVRSVLQWKENS